MLERAKHEHDDGEPEDEDLAGGVARREAEDDSHADHRVGGDGAQEDLAPVWVVVSACACVEGFQRHTEVFQLELHDLVEIASVLRVVEQVCEIAEEVCCQEAACPVAEINEEPVEEYLPKRHDSIVPA